MQVSAVNTEIGACDLCGNLGHSREEYALAQPVIEQANYMGNQEQKHYNNNFQPAPPIQSNVSQKPSELEIALQKLSQSTSTFVDQTQSFM
ncbi:hypothetical protein PIB30_072090 [Stylosanthes scabra]|uniref:CCHC-type domain-containing protein n=1 Tax=Stylosanthes scabra TaxID=79078 RepID=A0ABU6TNN0_9FABA|nr:hypothetical protein [Stylosanthes scabra]